MLLYFISGKLRPQGVSTVPGSDSLSETLQDMALHLPFFNPGLPFDLHFTIGSAKIDILPDFASPMV